MGSFKGIIIEESLENKGVLKKIKIISTKIEKVNKKHKTPWLKRWTLHKVEILERDAGMVAEEISKSLEKAHSWYADFKNETHHYIIFRGMIFLIKRDDKKGYDMAREYGISLGIPEYQVDFSPDIK